MNEVQLAAALTAGVAGLASLPHCFAMCGPLAAAGCGAGEGWKRRGAAYAAGRLVGYAAVGALLGSFGGRLIHSVADSHVNTLAAAVVVAVCLYHAAKRLLEAWHKRQSAHEPLQGAASGALVTLRRGSAVSNTAVSDTAPTSRSAVSFVASLLPRAPLALGLATAILPCGALVGAWVLAAATAHPVAGALSMFAFAVASSPALLAAVIGRGAMARLGVKVPALVAAAGWVAVAALLLGRLWLTQGGAPCH